MTPSKTVHLRARPTPSGPWRSPFFSPPAGSALPTTKERPSAFPPQDRLCHPSWGPGVTPSWPVFCIFSTTGCNRGSVHSGILSRSHLQRLCPNWSQDVGLSSPLLWKSGSLVRISQRAEPGRRSDVDRRTGPRLCVRPWDGPMQGAQDCCPGEGPLTWEGAAFYSPGAARALDRASSPSCPWSSCGLCHAPTRRRRWAAEKGVGGTHWPGIWHQSWLVNEWRPPEHTNQFMPSILPVGGSTRNFFSPRRFSDLGNLVCATRNGLEGEASIGREPRLLVASSSKEAHLNCVSNITTPRKGDLGGRASPRGAWTASP